jgi:hypothetical protein
VVHFGLADVVVNEHNPPMGLVVLPQVLVTTNSYRLRIASLMLDEHEWNCREALRDCNVYEHTSRPECNDCRSIFDQNKQDTHYSLAHGNLHTAHILDEHEKTENHARKRV